MVEKIIWTATAREDLREIVLRIAADRPLLAETYGLELIAAAETVAKFPHLGRFVPEFEDQSLREIIKAPYRIIYELFPHQPRPVIMRVWHGARGTPEIVRPPSL
jgi:plasmid stabilization system protein ParE